MFRFQFCCLCLLFDAASSMIRTPLYMYAKDYPPVLEYDNGSGINDFEKSVAPRIVEFYSPTCGGCQRFKSRYLELVKEMNAMHPQVEFYAVSCNAHRPFCNQYSIRSMPTLMAFRKGSSEGTLLERKMMQKGGYGLSTLLEGLGLEKVTNTNTNNIAAERMLIDEQPEDEVSVEEEEEAQEVEESGEEGGFNEDSEDGDTDNDAPSYSDADTLTGLDRVEDTQVEAVAREIPGDDDNEVEEVSDEEEQMPGEIMDGVEVEDSISGREVLRYSEDQEAANDWPDAGDFDEDADEKEPYEEEEVASSPEYDDDDDDDEIANEIGMDRPLFTGATLNRDPQPVYRKSVNQFKTILAEERKEVATGRKHAKALRDRDKNIQEKVFVPGAAQEARGSTKTMLANTPGTPEFEKRQADLSNQWKKSVRRIKKFGKKNNSQSSFLATTLATKKLKKETFVHKSIKRVPGIKRFAKVTKEEELYWDACQSLIEGLRHNVFALRLPLDSKKRAALKSWLQLMSVSLPPEWAIHELIGELLANFSIISMSKENLERVLDKHVLPRRGWSPKCNHGMLDNRGMNCGFWKLLHIASVGFTEHRGGNFLVEGRRDNDMRIFSPREAAATIREFMAYFYGNCDTCRLYFLTTYDECQFDVCNRLTPKATSTDPVEWKQLALWIWAIHNDVSVMVANKNNVQQAVHPVKVLWPSIKTCIICFEQDGSWDEDAVFEHLENTYWSLSIDPKTDRLLTRTSTTFSSLLYVMFALALGFVGITRRRVRNVSPFFYALKHSGTRTFRGAKVRKV